MTTHLETISFKSSEPATNHSQAKNTAARCPVDHSYFSQQKTAPAQPPAARPIEQDAQGIWHVRGYEEAKTVLRSLDTKQAGFKAELIQQMPGTMHQPVLYQEGEAHLEQRKRIARFFTPKTTSSNYRQMMENFSDKIIAQLQQRHTADLSQLSMRLAVQVASQVVGLTSSLLPGIDRRLNAFFVDAGMEFRWHPKAIYDAIFQQVRMLQFFYLDVKPAIRARKRHPQEDVISHLIEQGYSDAEILIECITYGAAGMVTTREFICIAAWHLLEQPELRQLYLQANEDERHHLLNELLRLEPVVGNLQRRATNEITLTSQGQTFTIPKGALLNVHIHATNVDQALVGDHPTEVCPARQLSSRQASPAVMSFGDGAHRCPGAYIAIQESDIFLQRLLAIDSLRIVQPPTTSWGALTNGYEFRNFKIAL